MANQAYAGTGGAGPPKKWSWQAQRALQAAGECVGTLRDWLQSALQADDPDLHRQVIDAYRDALIVEAKLRVTWEIFTRDRSS